jgi:hypothetical protein
MSIESNLQAAINCSKKCDCCASLQSQINQLNQRLNGYIPQSEKPQIIQQSVATAEQLILPAAGVLAYQASQALMPAINSAIAAASGAASTAANAATLAASTAAKLAGVVTQIAALLGILGVLSVLGSRIDAIENGLGMLGADVSRVFGLLPPIRNAANQAQSLANQAIREVYDLKSLLDSAISALRNYVDSRIESLSSYLNGLISAVSQKLDNFISQFVSSLSSVITRIGKIESDITALQISVSKALTDSANAIVLAKDALGQIADIRPAVNRIPGIESAVAALQGRIADLEAQMAGVPGIVSKIVGELVPPLVGSLVPPIVQAQVPPIVQAQVPPIVQAQVPPIVQAQVPPIVQSLIPPYLEGLVPSIINNITNIVNNTITNITNSMNVDLTPILVAVANVDTKVTSTLAFVGRIDATTQETKRDVKTINDKMGDKLPKGLSGWMMNFTGWAVIDRVIGILTLAASVHNAVQLSSNIGATLIQAMQATLDIFGITDSEGKAYDLQTTIGKGLDSLAESIIGKQNLVNFKLQWAKWNRIYQSASNLSSNVRQLFDSSFQLAETTAENTGKIGNALRDNGVVAANAYNQMAEKYQGVRDKRFGKMINGLEGLDNAASSISSITSDIKDIKDEVQEVKDARAEFKKSLQELKPDDKPIVNKPVADREKKDDNSTKPPVIKEGDENGG